MLRKVNGRDVLGVDRLNWLTTSSFLKTAHLKMAIIASVKNVETKRRRLNYGIEIMYEMWKVNG